LLLYALFNSVKKGVLNIIAAMLLAIVPAYSVGLCVSLHIAMPVKNTPFRRWTQATCPCATATANAFVLPVVTRISTPMPVVTRINSDASCDKDFNSDASCDKDFNSDASCDKEDCVHFECRGLCDCGPRGGHVLLDANHCCSNCFVFLLDNQYLNL
jgi:hypothetical protein